MLRYLVGRILTYVARLFVVSFLVFVVLSFVPNFSILILG